MTTRMQVLRYLNGAPFPLTNEDIAQAVHRPEPSVRRMTGRLAGEGLLMDVSEGEQHRYLITTAGTSEVRVRPRPCGC